MKKRIGSLLLILALCFTLLPTAALAEESVAAWDGSIATAFAGGSGTGNDPYQIADGAQLAYLANSVNGGESYADTYFVLTANIDLGNKDWTPIANSFSDALLGGSNYRVFAGNFDGNGCVWFFWRNRGKNQQLESEHCFYPRYSKGCFDRCCRRICRRSGWFFRRIH